MCNLGEGIREEALKDGFRSCQQNMILRMFQKGYTIAQIANIAELPENQIKVMVQEKELATV